MLVRRPWSMLATLLVGSFLVALARAEPGVASPGVPAQPAPSEPAPSEPASSEPASPMPAPGRVEPPHAVNTAVPYPPGAQGAATVRLELTVAADGSVREARVLAGDEPFASAALEAARAWRFEPARRDRVPLAARIVFVVRFTPPEPEPEPEPSAGVPAPLGDASAAAGGGRAGRGGAAAALAAEPEEVVVRGARASPAAVSVTREEADRTPGAFGDPFRAIESVPGITPIVSGMPFFFVRGAPPGNVGFFIDGVRVPMLYHAFIGPSVLHPALIGQVDLYRGGYPARFGRYAGGIVTAQTRRPDGVLHGEASVRLVDAGLMLSAPFDGQRGQAFVSGRYSYTGVILSALSNAVLAYWDYQALGSYELTPNGTLSLLAFGASDYVGSDDGAAFAGTDFHRVDLRYDHRFGRATEARVAATFGRDRSLATDGSVQDDMLAARATLSHQASPRLGLRFGADAMRDRIDLKVDESQGMFTDFLALFPSREDLALGLWSEAEWEPAQGSLVVPGLRLDLYRSAPLMAVAVDPRLAMRQVLGPKVTAVHAIGVAHQPPNFVPGLPGARVGGLVGGLQRSVQASAGVEVELPAALTASGSVFDNVFTNLSDPLGYSRKLALDSDVAELRSLGSAIGAELMVKRPLTRRLGGAFSYTVSRSTRSHGRVESLSAFDLTHVASLLVGYEIGRSWRLGGRSSLSSGVPTRHLSTEGPRFDGSERATPFFRLDLRVDKRWRVGEAGWWGLVVEVANATASQQVTSRSCNVVRCTEGRVGPIILPNLGIEAGF